MDALILFLFLWSVVGAAVGYGIGKGKGRGRAGFWWGLLLGWIGWIIVAVMEPSVEAQAQRDLKVAEATRRLSPAASSNSYGRARSNAERDAAIRATRGMREAASRDDTPAPIIAAIEKFAADVNPQRHVASWFFADGTFPVVAQYDGITYLVSASVVRRVRAGGQTSYDETPDGRILGATVDNVWLPRTRPDAEVRMTLTVWRSRRNEREARSGEIQPREMTSPNPRVAATTPIRERLASLDELHTDGVISAEEHAQRRQAILDEL